MKYEINTGTIIAARFADKIRKSAFAIFKNKVSTEEIVRSVAEANMMLYEKMTSAGIGKLDVVRITIEATVENGKIVFSEPKIERFVPYSEVEKIKEECEKKLSEFKNKLNILFTI